jgi:hypothetical protein
MLNVPKNSTVSIYNSGCCGMAGSFGYEKNIMTLVCKWGGYFISKIRSTAQQPLLQQQVPVAVIKF